MKGAYDIRVSAKRLSYSFTIKRKITVVKGDSATGKTTLMDLLNNVKAGMPGYSVQCKTKCMVLSEQYWELTLRETTDTIIFIEGESFDVDITSKEFASAVKQSDNYFVIITRLRLGLIPYSIDECFKIITSGKYHYFSPVFTRSYLPFKPTVVITEDSGSGFAFFSQVCGSSVKCVSAGGRDNIQNILKGIRAVNEKILVIADAAALGAEFSNILEMVLNDNKNQYSLLLPESFEQFLLASPVFESSFNGTDLLTNPENHVTANQFSWENYFTDLIIETTVGTPAAYGKTSLRQCYLRNCCFAKPCKFMIPGEKIKMILESQCPHVEFPGTTDDKKHDNGDAKLSRVSWFT